MSAGRRVLPTLVAAVLTAALVVSAQLLPVPPAGSSGQPVATIGRQLTVCPVDRSPGDRTQLGAAVASGLSGGRLVGTGLADPSITVIDLDQAGTADQANLTGSVLLRSEGGFSGGAAGTVLTTSSAGPGQGISLAGCQSPSTQHWFTGVAADARQTTRLVLTNPDSAEATVDLHFFGPDGAIGAPGSLGITVAAATTKSVSLTGLLPSGIDGPVAAQVTTSQGRVSAYAQSTYRADLQPAGDGVASAMPTPLSSLVIPGVPGGPGRRDLVLANPTNRRTTVTVEVLGADGTFAPADGATVDVNAQSTASVSLTDALDGEPVAIRLTSPQTITAAMVSTSARTDAAADVAVQTAAAPLRGVGLQAYAFAVGLSGTLLVSNAGDEPATVTVGVATFTGKAANDRELTVEPGATATVDLPDDADGYVTLRTESQTVYAGVSLAQDSGAVAGLATAPVTSSAAAAIGSTVVLDPHAGTQ